jgi:flagellar secretion chaperone FliS
VTVCNLPVPRSATSSVVDADLLHASPEQLVPLLYAHLLRHLRAAAEHMPRGDVERRTHHFEQALAILFELLATLDFERGGEVAPRLAALYSYFASEIIGIGRSLDLELLRRITGMIAGLHESWEQVAARSVTETLVAGGASARPRFIR